MKEIKRGEEVRVLGIKKKVWRVVFINDRNKCTLIEKDGKEAVVRHVKRIRRVKKRKKR